MKYLLFIFSMALLLPSCKKSRTIEVRAVNPVTGEPYAGQTFSIRSCRSGAFEDNCKTVYEGVTNENGVALIETRLNTNRRHTLFMAAPDDYCYRSIPSYNIDEELDHQEITFEFAPCAFLKLKIDNVNCQGSSDKIVLYHEGSDIGYIDALSGQPIIEGDGCFFYEGSSFSNVPMGRRFYKWEVTRGGGTQTFYDTLYLEAGEQKVYEINF